MLLVRSKIVLAAVLCTVGSTLTVVRIVHAQSKVSTVGQRLEGTWHVTSQATGTLQNLALFTGDGGFVAVPTGRTTTGAESAALGSWIRTGDRQFAVTQYRFTYDTAGSVTGTRKIRWNLTLNDTLDGFTAPYTSDILDLSGNVVSTTQSTLLGKRISVEPLE